MAEPTPSRRLCAEAKVEKLASVINKQALRGSVYLENTRVQSCFLRNVL